MLITTFCMSERSKNKYSQFLREKGLAKKRYYPMEIKFTLDKGEYELFEYLI